MPRKYKVSLEYQREIARINRNVKAKERRLRAKGYNVRLPVKTKKAAVRNRFFNYIVLQNGYNIAMRERLGKDIWKGLYDFHLIESPGSDLTPDELAKDVYFNQWALEGQLREVGKVYTHLLTHQRLHIRFWCVILSKNAKVLLPENMRFYSPNEIETLPKPIVIDQLLREENFL